LLGVNVEPFGRDHATKGGSYDTGAQIAKDVFAIEPPFPVPYEFINKTGDTKKMSKSKGDTITAAQLLKMLPAEVVWFFVIRYAPDKILFFDEGETLMRIVDEFSELLAKENKTEQEKQLLALCMQGVEKQTISNIPFSHLVASYQAALKDSGRTLEIIRRTEYKDTVDNQEEIIKAELRFIDHWLEYFAPEEVKFSVARQVDASQFSPEQQKYLQSLAHKIAEAPEGADGEWFHKAIYEFKNSSGLEPKQLFTTLYQALIGKDSGPRAGWFLSILPRKWLIKRLRLER
jgi:lysyl-tRNA synthetase class 1